jgi:hypothetical protein
LAPRLLAGVLEGPAQGGRNDLVAMGRLAERQFTRVVAVIAPVVMDNVDTETVRSGSTSTTWPPGSTSTT